MATEAKSADKIHQYTICSSDLDRTSIELSLNLTAMQSKLDALKRHQAETAAELDALLPAVLERAFRGEL